MKKVQSDIKQFMQEMDQETPERPSVPDMKVCLLRYKLIDEEINEELLPAINNDDIVGIADACADAVYVIVGTAIAYGIDLVPIWEEVQRTNMLKTTGPIRPDGKRLKPEGWIAPDIAGLIQEQIRKDNHGRENN